MAARKHEDRATRPRAAATRFRCILVEPLYENKTLTTGTLKRRILGRKNFFFSPQTYSVRSHRSIDGGNVETGKKFWTNFELSRCGYVYTYLYSLSFFRTIFCSDIYSARSFVKVGRISEHSFERRA